MMLARGSAKRSCPATAVAIASTILVATVLNGPRMDACGDDRAHSGPGPSASGKVTRQSSVVEARRALNDACERLIGLAERALHSSRSNDARNQLRNLRIELESTNAKYLNAKLAREIAEIGVIEYKDGIFVQDLATVEGEIQLARSERDRAKDWIEFTKDRLARISARSEKTATDLNIEYAYSDKVIAAERDASKRQVELDQLEAKKKLLVEYTKPRRLKELQAEVERQRAEELASQAEWESRNAQQEKLQRIVQQSDSTVDMVKVLAALDRAIPIAEQARDKVERLAKDEKADESLLKEVRGLTEELNALLDEGEALWSSAEFAGLKPRIEEAARRFGAAAK